MKIVCAAVVIALLAQQKANPDLKYDEQAGLSISKVPKNDEWAFKDKGYFDKSKVCVAHKVDEIGIDILHVLPAPNTSGWDLKKVADADFSQFSSAPGVTEMKRITRDDKARLPNNGAGGAVGTYMEMSFKRAEKPVEYRYWNFVAKQNGCLYLVILHSDEGMYKKHQKVVDYVLGTIQTWKLPK